MGTGVILAKTGASIGTLTAGTVAGSMLGSTIGQYFDNQGSLMREDPINAPVYPVTYVMFRPTLTIECFKPGQVGVPPAMGLSLRRLKNQIGTYNG